MTFRRITLALILVGSLAPALDAQNLAALPRGTLVRVFTSPPGVWRSGTIVGIEGDTLRLTACPACEGVEILRLNTISALDVSRDDHGSRLKHSVAGFGLGLLAGVVAGSVLGHIEDKRNTGEASGFATAYGQVLGAFVGGAAGLFIGFARPAGEQWQRVRVR